jgi:hypothetical protein
MKSQKLGHVELTRKKLEQIKVEFGKKREFVHVQTVSGDLVKREDGKYILGMYNISGAYGGLVFGSFDIFVRMLKKYFPNSNIILDNV